MVFDDITEVVSAQRSAAWAEVARRLAHEIKNPLTPIQLSAERLQHKLESKLEGHDQALLQRSVATIVSQVQSMKQLVNEFRDYARLPAAQLMPLDLNVLVGEVLALYGENQDQGRLTAQLDGGLPPIMGDASQLRQVVHNLVQNALDAVADKSTGQVRVATSAALWREWRAARRATDRHGQRPGLCRQRAAARVRALHHHQEQGHRPGPGRGEEDRRRTPCPRTHRQPAQRQTPATPP